jgi:hypothetical protein
MNRFCVVEIKPSRECHSERSEESLVVLLSVKTNLWTITSIFAVAVSFVTPYTAGSERDDHLVPADPLFQKYRQFLTSKLGHSPFNCGRVFIEPAFNGESAISVYCVSAKHLGQKCRVTYAEASDNLWQRTNALQNVERASRVKIRRIDAEISTATALSVRSTFSRILKMTQPHTTREGERRRLTTDATQTEFSLAVQGESQLWAQPDVSLVRQGEQIRNLLNLSRLLVDYCKAEGRDKPHIERTAAQIAGAR